MASSNSVNGLAKLALDWFNTTSSGRSVYDDMVRFVVLMQLDKNTGAYVRDEKLPVTSRKNVIAQLRALGAR